MSNIHERGLTLAKKLSYSDTSNDNQKGLSCAVTMGRWRQEALSATRLNASHWFANGETIHAEPHGGKKSHLFVWLRRESVVFPHYQQQWPVFWLEKDAFKTPISGSLTCNRENDTHPATRRPAPSRHWHTAPWWSAMTNLVVCPLLRTYLRTSKISSSSSPPLCPSCLVSAAIVAIWRAVRLLVAARQEVSCWCEN